MFTEDLPFAEGGNGAWILYFDLGDCDFFKQATELKEVVRELPLERLLIETDSPYLAPVPHRGKENQPAYAM